MEPILPFEPLVLASPLVRDVFRLDERYFLPAGDDLPDVGMIELSQMLEVDAVFSSMFP